MFRKLRSQGPWLVLSAVVLGLLISSFAVAAGEGRSLLGGTRNPGTDGSKTFSRETEIIANTSTYGTRQSNKSDNGGGAVYGCRSKAGGTPKGNEPCVRGSNLADGRAFEFETRGGTEVGTITSSNPNAAPFTTNAKGVATGLNADQVDGKNVQDIEADALKAAQGLTEFAAVAANGTLAGARGATASARMSEGTYNVVFANDISACAFSAVETQVNDAGAVGVELAADKKTVTVRTRAGGGADGTGATAPADRPFHLVISC
jgi:hypothetical protein